MSEGFTLWFTGLSGAGKSTLAGLAAEELRRRGYRVEVLDGDEVRTNLSKGLYKKALAGELKGFTGVSDPYEPPLKHELTVATGRETAQESLVRLLGRLEERGYID